MKKYTTQRYVKGSPQYVITYAKFQKFRGRNPSVVFKGVRNPKKALAAAIKELEDREARERAYIEQIHQNVKTRPKVWRTDRRDCEHPTVNFEVVHAEDVVGFATVYHAYVLHVNTIHGKGFRGFVKCGGTSESTDTFIGINEKQYTDALEGARRLLVKKEEDIDKMLKEQDRLFHKFRCKKEVRCS